MLSVIEINQVWRSTKTTACLLRKQQRKTPTIAQEACPTRMAFGKSLFLVEWLAWCLYQVRQRRKREDEGKERYWMERGKERSRSKLV